MPCGDSMAEVTGVFASCGLSYKKHRYLVGIVVFIIIVVLILIGWSLLRRCNDSGSDCDEGSCQGDGCKRSCCKPKKKKCDKKRCKKVCVEFRRSFENCTCKSEREDCCKTFCGKLTSCGVSDCSNHVRWLSGQLCSDQCDSDACWNEFSERCGSC